MSNAVEDFLTDKNGEQSKSHKWIIIALVVGIIIAILVFFFRNAASNATSNQGSGGTISGGSGGSVGTTPTDTSSLSYQQGLADIQNASAKIQEQLQEQLLNAQEASQEKLSAFNVTNSEGLATFNSGLQQTNTMNAINDLIYSEKAQFSEQQSEQTTGVQNLLNAVAPIRQAAGNTLSWQGANNLINQLTSNAANPTASGSNSTLTAFWQNLNNKNTNQQATG